MLQRRGGIGLASFVAVLGAVGTGVVGCGGPLDSPEPRPKSHPDAGTGGKRVVDAGSGIGGSPGFDAAPDVQWPVILGCVSGQPPSPLFSPNFTGSIAVGCTSSTIQLGLLSDAARQGMVYSTRLDPLIDGAALLSPTNTLCGYANAPISLVIRGSAFRPGETYATSLSITPVGPPPQKSAVFGLTVNAVPIDFSVGPATIDFGTVTVGQYLQQSITVTNALDGVPFDSLYATPTAQGPFILYALSTPFAGSVRPGEARQMFQATFNPQTTGTFDATFLVSAFQPGVLVDPSCGVIRSITMHAQVTGANPPVP